MAFMIPHVKQNYNLYAAGKSSSSHRSSRRRSESGAGSSRESLRTLQASSASNGGHWAGLAAVVTQAPSKGAKKSSGQTSGSSRHHHHHHHRRHRTTASSRQTPTPSQLPAAPSRSAPAARSLPVNIKGFGPPSHHSPLDGSPWRRNMMKPSLAATPEESEADLLEELEEDERAHSTVEGGEVSGESSCSDVHNVHSSYSEDLFGAFDDDVDGDDKENVSHSNKSIKKGDIDQNKDGHEKGKSDLEDSQTSSDDGSERRRSRTGSFSSLMRLKKILFSSRTNHNHSKGKE